MWVTAFDDRADEDDEINDPDDRQPQVDIPFGLGIFARFGDAHDVAGRGEHQKELIAPEDEARGAWKGEPRAAGTLNDIEARRDQRVAAERKNHSGRVQRAQSPEAGKFDAEVERRKGELQGRSEKSRVGKEVVMTWR